MANIREKVGDNDELKQEWQQCMEPIMATISERYSRLSLKGEQVCISNY